MTKFAILGLLSLSLIAAPGCSSDKLPVKQEKFAKLRDRRTYEYEYPAVWKAILAAFTHYSIEEKDVEEGTIETDWVYSRSNDKYVSYKVNGLPRRKAVQTRVRYELKANKVMGGVEVIIQLKEEIEQLNRDGSSSGWTEAAESDTSRTHEILEKIQTEINRAPNT